MSECRDWFSHSTCTREFQDRIQGSSNVCGPNLRYIQCVLFWKDFSYLSCLSIDWVWASKERLNGLDKVKWVRQG